MNTNDQKSSRAGGPGLRSKLSLGFVGLLAILLAVGVESIDLLDHLGGSIDVILRENYRSVIASERMKESLERMDSGALFALAGEEARGRALVLENRPRFEEALQTALGNITLPGEGEKTQHLRQLFGAYLPVLDRILDPGIPLEARRLDYFGRLLPAFQQIKATAGEISQMNQQNMVEANNRARALAAEAGRRMAVLLLLGTLFAGICIAFLLRSIFTPLVHLTRAVRQVEGGDLDVSVPIRSQDEVGELASAFNSMAARLRELRRSDQARLLRVARVSQHTMDGLPEPVAALSADGQVEIANRLAESLLGLRPGEPVPEAYARWITPLLAHTEQNPRSAEPLRLPAAGGERFFRPRMTPLYDDEGRVSGTILALADITDQRRGGEITSTLLANASRDVDAALAPVGSALQLLQEQLGRLTPHQRDLLAAGQEGTGRLRQIAENLYGAARLETSRRDLHAAPLAPRDLIEAAARPLEEDARGRGVALKLEAEPGAPAVLADRERADLLLSLLLQNALAHTPAGGAVTVHAEADDHRTRFAVTDTGEGIPPMHQGRIFEPFFQVPGTEDQGGAGLGLSIARDIVQAHGGEIHCESAEGQGTTVWFTLPAAAL